RPTLFVAEGAAQQIGRVRPALPLHRGVVTTSLIHMHAATACFHRTIQLQPSQEVHYLVVTRAAVSRQSSQVRPRISYPRSSKFRLADPRIAPYCSAGPRVSVYISV